MQRHDRHILSIAIAFATGVLVAIAVMSGCEAFAQGADMGTEGGGNQQCYTKNLPANIWSLVSYDNAGQPCMTKPDADGTCDPTATWDWQLHGNVMIHTRDSLPPNAAYMLVQLWAGGGGGSCYGSTSDPIFCDNPASHYLQENTYYQLPAGQGFFPAPFEFRMFYQLAPYYATPSDANYQGYWLFVKPSVPAVCESANYGDLLYKDEAH